MILNTIDMKKGLLMLAVCFGFIANALAQDIGVTMSTTQQVYLNSNFTYTLPTDANASFAWEIYTDAACTATAAAGDYTVTGDKTSNTLTVSWNGPTPAADENYWIKITKTNDVGDCINFKILPVAFSTTNNWDVVFAAASSTSCSVEQTRTDVDVEITLSGDHYIHRTGELAKVLYTVDSEITPDASVVTNWLTIPLTATAGTTYTITIPAGKLIGKDATAEQSYEIRLFAFEDGAGSTKTFDSAKLFTWNAQALPVIVDIEF